MKTDMATNGLMSIALAILLVFTAGCDHFNYFAASTVTVHNVSDVTLTNVRVTMAEEALWTGSLAPGEAHEASGRPATDGTIGVDFEVKGKGTTFHREFGYVTGGIRQDHSVVVLPSLEMRYTVR